MQDNYRCPSTYALLFMLAVLNIAIFQVSKSLGNTTQGMSTANSRQ